MARAVVLTQSLSPGILATKLHADGSRGNILNVLGQVRNGILYGDPHVHMDGPAVFKMAVNVMANARIIDATGKRLGVPAEKTTVTVQGQRNTSAASIPMALDTAVRDGQIKAGDLLQTVAVSGGFTRGSALIRGYFLRAKSVAALG